MKSPASKKFAAEQTREEWVRQSEWLVIFVEKLSVNRSPHGKKWTAGMLKHYTRKFRRHMEHAPRWIMHDAKRYRTRMEKAAKQAQIVIDGK